MAAKCAQVSLFGGSSDSPSAYSPTAQICLLIYRDVRRALLTLRLIGLAPEPWIRENRNRCQNDKVCLSHRLVKAFMIQGLVNPLKKTEAALGLSLAFYSMS